MIEEITVSELNKKISNKEDFILLDVRTDSEYYLSNIEGAIHIPMNLLIYINKYYLNKKTRI
jgi:rhodanese-related sulfurtransferase